MMTLIKSLTNYIKSTEQFREDQQKLLAQIGNWISFSKRHLTKSVLKYIVLVLCHTKNKNYMEV